MASGDDNVASEVTENVTETVDSTWDDVIGAIVDATELWIAVVVVLLTWYLGKYAKHVLVRTMRKRGQQADVIVLTGRIIRWSIVVFGLLLAFTIAFPGADASTFFGTLGIGTVVAGFVLKDMLENFASGMTLLVTKPLRIGDQIEAGEHEGTIEDIQFRATIIRTYDNERVVIPNSDLLTDRFTVKTAYEHRRVHIDVLLGDTSRIDELRELILSTIAGIDVILEHPEPDVLVHEIDSYGVVLEARFWIAPPRRNQARLARSMARAAIEQAMLDAGMPKPNDIRVFLAEEALEQARRLSTNRTEQ